MGSDPSEIDRSAIDAIASRVFQSSKQTGFALMKANYVERNAREIPGGKIRGLTTEASTIASSLRDSIWARFDSLRFHYGLISNVERQFKTRLDRGADDKERFDIIWAALWHSQYLFDDAVFNVASLFDYLGNAVWFAFHGQNHIKKKWKRTYQAAKRPGLEAKMKGKTKIHGSRTGNAVLEAHRELVDKLYEYRSELIHNRMDGPQIYKTQFWQDTWHPDFRLPLPPNYVRLFHRKGSTERLEANSNSIVNGTAALVQSAGDQTLKLLAMLREDIGWTEGEPLTILG